MATTQIHGERITTIGDLPKKGSKAPGFTLTGSDLGDISDQDFTGKRVVLNIFPSLDTSVCAASVRKFNQLAAGLDNAVVVCASADLPFAQNRFCGAEGIDNVTTGSSFRTDFGKDYGVTMTNGPLAGLLARSVVIVDTDGTVSYTQLVPDIGQEPDYDAAIAALG